MVGEELLTTEQLPKCVICGNEEIFSRGEWKKEQGEKFRFDKCYSCAMKERDRLYKEFKAILSIEQMQLFERYHQANSDFTSMVILD